ncbi:MAG: undecaprenyl/decaprenyl-phosphate alpha-N-acetylglucosaminyl 1-phosphate transferase [Candidatus Kerfeldbacteria bacterium]|nr:undecaprenyl/decaprenyl-phosphate alpha-N-acetylglucosaminyl 1-phosphate transferase [Candidatus Kerfeldbacteria bacterium]
MMFDARDIGWAALALAASFVLTGWVRRIAIRRTIVDRPENAPHRKVHTTPVPLLGGLAPWGAFVLTVGAILLVQPDLLVAGYLLPKHLLGIMIGGLVLMIGGTLDDVRPRSARFQILWPMIAAVLILVFGISLEYISNPFGAPLRLDQWSLTLFTIGGLPYGIVLFADLFAWSWLMVAMYTTKFLDGLDGLVSGISVIGMIILAALSMSETVGQPETARIALIGAAAFLGFLFWNFHPAKIFLGEGGSLWAGFLLGTLAIISGGKIATALLILGIPMLDVVWVVLRRLASRPSSIVNADRKHLHYRLLEIGLSHRKTVLVLYLFAAIFGSATLFTSGKVKFLVLGLLVVLMVVLGTFLVARRKKRTT